MDYCKCGSIIQKEHCTNPNCGKRIRIWAQDDPHYYDDLKEDKPLIHAIRHNSKLVQSMGLHPSEPIQKSGYHLYIW